MINCFFLGNCASERMAFYVKCQLNFSKKILLSNSLNSRNMAKNGVILISKTAMAIGLVQQRHFPNCCGLPLHRWRTLHRRQLFSMHLPFFESVHNLRPHRHPHERPTNRSWSIQKLYLVVTTPLSRTVQHQ